MKKTLLFLTVAALISFVSIEGFKLSYNPPVIIKEVEKPVIVEKEVVKEVPDDLRQVENNLKKITERLKKVADFKQDEIYHENVGEIVEDVELPQTALTKGERGCR